MAHTTMFVLLNLNLGVSFLLLLLLLMMLVLIVSILSVLLSSIWRNTELPLLLFLVWCQLKAFLVYPVVYDCVCVCMCV